jgi:hypothetical protein
MSVVTSFLEFLGILKDLFDAYTKYKDDEWFKNLLVIKDQLNHADTPEEKQAVAKSLATLISNIK